MISNIIKIKPLVTIGFAFIVIGALFKIMHWQFAYWVFSFGCFSTIVLQCYVLIKAKPRKAIDYLSTALILGLIVHLYLKVSHLPYKQIPLSIAALALLGLVIWYLVQPVSVASPNKKTNKLGFIIFGASLILVVVGALFKILHWPMASTLLIAGLVSLAVYMIYSALSD